MKRLLFITLLIIAGTSGIAQLDNSAFEDRIEIDSSRQREIYFSLKTLGFFKNNEYSNDIADGFTLFGYQFNPYFSYFAGKNVRIDAGIYLQQDFGVDDFTEIAPYFSLKAGATPHGLRPAGQDSPSPV